MAIVKATSLRYHVAMLCPRSALFWILTALSAGCAGAPPVAPTPPPADLAWVRWSADQSIAVVDERWIFKPTASHFTAVKTPEGSVRLPGLNGQSVVLTGFKLEGPAGTPAEVPLWLSAKDVTPALVRLDTSNHCAVTTKGLYCEQQDSVRAQVACGRYDGAQARWVASEGCLTPPGDRLVYLTAGPDAHMAAVVMKRGRPHVRFAQLTRDGLQAVGPTLRLWPKDRLEVSLGLRGQGATVISRCQLHKPGQPCPPHRNAKGYPAQLFAVNLASGVAKAVREVPPFASPTPRHHAVLWVKDRGLCFEHGMGAVCHHPARTAGD